MIPKETCGPMNDILGDLNKSMDGMTSAEKSNIIGTIFNKTDLSSVNALLANTGSTWDSLQKSITESGGAAQQMADTQLDNLQGQITILKSALEGLAISFGELSDAGHQTDRGMGAEIRGLVKWTERGHEEDGRYDSPSGSSTRSRTYSDWKGHIRSRYDHDGCTEDCRSHQYGEGGFCSTECNDACKPNRAYYRSHCSSCGCFYLSLE